MIFYDALRSDFAPRFLRDTLPYGGRLLRALYDHRGAISTLTAGHRSDGVHLAMWAKPGFRQMTITDERLHHVNRLTDRIEEYAALFPTTKFVVETKRTPELLARLLPTWSQIGYTPDGAFRIEYTLP